jgi:hypothetical protein
MVKSTIPFRQLKTGETRCKIIMDNKSCNYPDSEYFRRYDATISKAKPNYEINLYANTYNSISY